MFALTASHLPKPSSTILDQAFKHHLLTIPFIVDAHSLAKLPKAILVRERVMHLSVPPHKDHFVFRILIGLECVVKALFLEQELLLIPFLDELSDVFFEILEHTPSCTGMFQPHTELLGDMMLFFLGDLCILLIQMRIVHVPKWSQIIRDVIMTRVGRLDVPVIGRGRFSPRIMQQAVLQWSVSIDSRMRQGPL